MVTSERLLRFISQLQHERTITHGRRMLLEYIRKTCRARLAAIFLLEQDRRSLTLLDYSGQRPTQAEDPSSSDHGTGRQSVQPAETIAGNGLFASALLTPGLLRIGDLYTNERALPEERAWGWPGGPVLLTAIRAGAQTESRQGVLVVSFAPGTGIRHIHDAGNLLTRESENELLICAVLLSAYLSHPQEQPSRLAWQLPGTAMQEQAVADRLPICTMPQQATLPEMIYSLTSLTEFYEIGLVAGSDIDLHTLYQHILTHLRNVVRAAGACLLLYRPAHRQFIVGAIQGERLPCSLLIPTVNGAEMERLAMRGPGETLTTLMVGGQLLSLVTLSYNTTLLGIVALALPAENTLLDERALLLSYMGNVAATILRNYDLRISEQKAAIDRERTRIARDIHDGAAQRLALVLLKLEYIERILERSSRSQQLQSAWQETKRARTMLKSSLEDLRHGIASLIPAQLEQQGLSSAIQALLSEFRGNNPDIDISYNIAGMSKIPKRLEVPLYRLLQEALNNISKHAQATQANIHIRALPKVLLVEVSDNGRGFQPEQVTSEAGQHVGLRAMRERVQEAGGRWEIQSRPGGGTTIRVSFPLASVPTVLTNREREVLHLIVEGLTNRAIAERLSISIETVKSHIHHIMQKMQVKDRTQAAVVATRQGWL